MVQSHAGYSRCGLGSDGTDRLVALVRQEQALARLHQETPVLYGAKITGGGSGGQFLAVHYSSGPWACCRMFMTHTLICVSSSCIKSHHSCVNSGR